MSTTDHPMSEITGFPIRVEKTDLVPVEQASKMVAELDMSPQAPNPITSEGMALVWLSGPLGAALYIDRPETVTKPAPGGIELQNGIMIRGWFEGGDWDEYTPASTPWNEGWRGIVWEGDGCVIYEDITPEYAQNIIGWHCSVCHDHEGSFVNEDPSTRRTLYLKVKQHLRGGHKPVSEEMERVVREVAQSMGLTPRPGGLGCNDCDLINDMRQ